MNLRLPNTFLIIGLLVSILGCAKKEVVPLPNTGSFQLDETPINCQATATLSAGSIGTTAYDFLEINLTPIQAAGGVVRLNLLFYKAPGASATTYSLNNLSIYTTGNTAPYNFASRGFALTAASNGSFSGSFAGIVSAGSSMIPGPYTTITNGVFTAVRP